jgi:hypothetical protein
VEPVQWRQQHQRRVQRDRIEGTRGQAAEAAVGQARGDHGDAGGELRQGLAEMGGIEAAHAGAGGAGVHLRIMPSMSGCFAGQLVTRDAPACRFS